ncbi:MAG: hypothetical protein M3R06_04625, partial [Chloroflexota bacterium]|nr:hypothetical protein [Chloroflexota bacterium]
FLKDAVSNGIAPGTFGQLLVVSILHNSLLTGGQREASALTRTTERNVSLRLSAQNSYRAS